MPILFVPGVGGTRLELVQARSDAAHESLDSDLWYPDDAAAQARLFDGIAVEANAEAASRASLDLARRWLEPARVLRDHSAEARVQLTRRLLGLDRASSLVPGLHPHLQVRYAHLKAQGWTALGQSYGPLAERLEARGDADVVMSAHAHGWDWRGTAASAAPALAERVAALLGQDGAHGTRTAWQWPAQRSLVIVAENSGVDVVRAALPLMPDGSVLAVYAVDDVNASPARGSAGWYAALSSAKGASMPSSELLSHGWREWRRRLQAQRGARLAVNAVLPGPLSLLPAAPAARWMRSGALLDTPADPV